MTDKFKALPLAVLLAASFQIYGLPGTAKPAVAEKSAGVQKPEAEKPAVTPIKMPAAADLSAEEPKAQTTEVAGENQTTSTAAETDKEADREAASKAMQEREAAAEKAQAMEEEVRKNEAAEHYEAARAYLANWQLALAEIELRASIMAVPKTMAAHRDYALVSLLRAQPMKMLAELLIVVGIGEPVPFSEQQCESIKDDGLKLHYRRGLELAQDSKWQDALTEFQWARTYRPGSAKVIRSMAFAYASLGKFDLAEKEYAQSFAVDPKDAYSHADFAFLLAAKGSAEKAVEQLSEAVKLQPKVAALHVDLGWMAESEGKLDKAESEIQEAVKLSPKHASLWTHLAKLQARQGKSDLARKSYEEALAIDPSQLDAKEGLARLSPADKLSPKN